MITFDVVDKDGDPNDLKLQACIFKVSKCLMLYVLGYYSICLDLRWPCKAICIDHHDGWIKSISLGWCILVGHCAGRRWLSPRCAGTPGNSFVEGYLESSGRQSLPFSIWSTSDWLRQGYHWGKVPCLWYVLVMHTKLEYVSCMKVPVKSLPFDACDMVTIKQKKNEKCACLAPCMSLTKFVLRFVWGLLTRQFNCHNENLSDIVCKN